MCCCIQPNVNGTPNVYRWNPTDTPMTRKPSPPTIGEQDTIIFDEPGRCGGVDVHHQHHTLVMRGEYSTFLLTRNGLGDHGFRVDKRIVPLLTVMNSNERFRFFEALYDAHSEGEKKATASVNKMWREAAAEKRIKVRKVRGKDAIGVHIQSRGA